MKSVMLPQTAQEYPCVFLDIMTPRMFHAKVRSEKGEGEENCGYDCENKDCFVVVRLGDGGKIVLFDGTELKKPRLFRKTRLIDLIETRRSIDR